MVETGRQMLLTVSIEFICKKKFSFRKKCRKTILIDLKKENKGV